MRTLYVNSYFEHGMSIMSFYCRGGTRSQIHIYCGRWFQWVVERLGEFVGNVFDYLIIRLYISWQRTVSGFAINYICLHVLDAYAYV